MVFHSYLIMLDNGIYIKLYDYIKINNVRKNIMRFFLPQSTYKVMSLRPTQDCSRHLIRCAGDAKES